jgi:hypothetical protein
MIQNDENFFNKVIFTDEATFHKNGYVNRQNFHYYSNENPNFVRAIDNQYRWTINVWGGIVRTNVIGPHFFEGNLDGNMYMYVPYIFLQNIFYELLGDVPLDIRRNL